MRELLADCRHAARLYRRTPTASVIAIAIAMLTIGMAFVAAFISLDVTTIGNILIGVATLTTLGLVFFRLIRWARRGSRGTQILGSVLSEVTHTAVYEAKQGKKGKKVMPGPAERQMNIVAYVLSTTEHL